MRGEENFATCAKKKPNRNKCWFVAGLRRFLCGTQHVSDPLLLQRSDLQHLLMSRSPTDSSTEPLLLMMPSHMLVNVLQYVRAQDMAHCEMLCKMMSSCENASSMALTEHAAMLRCKTSGWKKVQSLQLKRT